MSLTPKVVLPETVKRVEVGAGVQAGHSDEVYRTTGATVASREEVLRTSQVVTCVGLPLSSKGFGPQHTLIGFLDSLSTREHLRSFVEAGVRLVALERVPRSTAAQTMDALSSMAMVAGYKAVLLGAEALPRMFPLLMTAAGTIPPAKVLVLGGGVAGLMAMSTARRLGATVSGYDIREAAREQIESVGARFVSLGVTVENAEAKGGYARALDEEMLERLREALEHHVAGSDVVICTAAARGRRAPVLVSRRALEGMRPGSVVIDLVAQQGGNTEVSSVDAVIQVGGVQVMAPRDTAALVPEHASQLLAQNMVALIRHLDLKPDGHLGRDLSDPIVHDVVIAEGGAFREV